MSFLADFLGIRAALTREPADTARAAFFRALEAGLPALPAVLAAFLAFAAREPATFRAFKAGQVISLEPKALRLLLFLIENRGRLIEKEEILDSIWTGTHVTENALTREIGKLRKTLGDDPKSPKYIETVHTRGYRFIAELAEANGKRIQVSADVEHVEARPESFRAAQPAVAAVPLAFEGTSKKRTHSYRLITTVITIAFLHDLAPISRRY